MLRRQDSGRIRRKSCDNRTYVALTSGDGPHDHKRLIFRRDCLGERRVRQLVRQILPAGEESNKRAAPLRDVVADRPRSIG
jgi:hypothetical protein